MFATWCDRARLRVDRAGSPDADPGEPHRLHARIVEGFAERLGELEDDRVRPAPPRRLAPRPAEHGRRPVRHDRLDLRPAEVEPALHPRHGSHRTTSSIGLRFARALHSAAVCRSGSRARSGIPNESTITGVSSSAAASAQACGLGVPDPVRARREPLRPGGEQHALGGAARVEENGPLAAHEDRDDETRAEDVLRDEDGAGELLDPRAPFRHDERPRLPVPRRSRQPPGVEQAEHELARQRLGERAALVATAGDREQRVHRASVVGSCPPR